MVPRVTFILSALPYAKNKGLNMDTRQEHARGLEYIKSAGKTQCLYLFFWFVLLVLGFELSIT
jgi:hypothetical protein